MLIEISLMNVIHWVSKEIKWKVKVVLLEGIIDELHSWDIQRDRKEGKSGVSRTIIDELHSSDIQGDQTEGESGVTRIIIDEYHSSDIERNQIKCESVSLEVSLMNFVLRISN